MDKIYLLIGNDTPMAVCLRKSEGEETPVPYDLSEARRLRLTLVGHGMRVCAKDIEVSGDDNNIVSGVIQGRSLMKGDYDLELTFTLDGRDKRFAVDDMFEAVDFLAEDADGEAEGEGAGIFVTVTVQPELIEISGPAGPQGKSAYQVWLDDGHTGTEDDFFEWLAAQTPNPDWNQNDSTKADFIKNRTHYEETATASLEWDTDVADTSRKLYLNLGGNRVTLNPYIGLFGLLYWRDVENNWEWQVTVGDTLELWEQEDGENVRHEQYDGFAFATTPQPFNLGFGEETTVHKLDNKYLDLDSTPTLNSQKPVTSDGVKRALNALPTVPVISTDVEADGTSDTKTSSPKSVKTFVEGKGYYTKPQSGIPASDIAAGVIPTVPTDTVKYSTQSLTDAQKEQARTNIGAADADEVSQLRSEMNGEETQVDLTRYARQNSRVLKTDGTIISTTSGIYAVDTFRGITENTKYIISGRVGLDDGSCLVCFYDSSDVFIAGSASVPSTGIGTPYQNIQVTSPPGATFMRICGSTNTSYPYEPSAKAIIKTSDGLVDRIEEIEDNSIKMGDFSNNGLDFADDAGKKHVILRIKDGHIITKNFNSRDVNSLSKIAGLRVLCIGDSLTAGDYGSEPAGTQHVHSENYPYYLGQYLNCQITNKGVPGATAANWWSNQANTITYTDYDVAIIMFGTNAAIPDSLATDVEPFADYNDYTGQDGALCKIIEYALAQNPKLSILLCTPPFVDNTRRPANYNNVVGSQDGVKSIGRRYGVPVLDMFYAGGFSKFNTLVMQPVDGLHFGIFGYQRLATRMASFLLGNLSFILDYNAVEPTN